MRDNQKRGQWLLILAFGLLMLVTLGIPALAVVMRGTEVMKSYVFRKAMADTFYSVVCFGTLGYLMWTGKSWAKWLLIFFVFAAALLGLARADELHGTPLVVIISGIVLSFLISIMLAMSKDIASFIQYKAAKRRAGSSLHR